MDNLKDLPVVYIDETGIDRYLYRPYARAPRGEKVYEKISGRRFERTSIVTGQIDGEFIAPMIKKESMTSDLGSIIFVVGKSPMDIMEPILL